MKTSSKVKDSGMGKKTEKGSFTELKQRLLFLLLGILVFRIGSHIPVPGLNPEKLAHLFGDQQNSILGLFNMFSGGALSHLTLFAIGIMPYISASIIIQLFSVLSPRLEQLKKEGGAGKRKINQYTRYATLVLAVFQSFGMAKWLVSNGIALEVNFLFYLTATLTLVTGTMLLMWLGEQITEKGIGNGISLIIFSGIVSRLPASLSEVFGQVRDGEMQGISLLFIFALIVAVIAFVVFIERGQRRIRVNYPQRTQGKKIFAAQSTHLPLKINMAGVIPPIFASSIIILPATLCRWFGNSKGLEWLGSIGQKLSPDQLLYLVLYTVAIVFFAFFYTALVFNPKDTADNLKKSGAFIPGIRPGEQTATYVDSVMTKLTLIGALYLVLVCLLPEVFRYTWHVPFYFGGTSLLIIVVVVMDFIAQIQSHLVSHQYESLMKKSPLKSKSTRMPGIL